MSEITPIMELKVKVASLQEALLHKHPTMPTLLREIHTALKKQPENMTLLDEEEINVIVNGLEKQTGFELAQTVTKSAKSSSASLKAKIANKGIDAF